MAVIEPSQQWIAFLTRNLQPPHTTKRNAIECVFNRAESEIY